MIQLTTDIDITDFYLYFNEGFQQEQPRRCIRINRVSFGATSGISALLVAVDSPLRGELYGLSAGDVSYLLLSGLFKGQSFFPVDKWPMQVHIYIPLIEEPELRGHLKVSEVKNIALGEIQLPNIGG